MIQSCIHIRNGRRGFTAMELMIVILIMSIVASLGVDTISTFEANQRAERAARESLTLFRYARYLALSTGKSSKVEIDATAGMLAVYWMSNGTSWDATPVTHTMFSGGAMRMTLSSMKETAGTTMTVTPAGTTSFIYGMLGSCGTAGTVKFSYGTKSKTLTIPSVGEVTVN
jgi:prepilin-type N-terminal cleavage/methylation domain-containing protein